MAAQTFRDLWSRVALHVPGAPISLVQAWVQDAHDRLLGTRHWAWTRRETILRTLASRAVTVTFTQDSTAITSVAGFVVATDPGRQIRIPNGPIYTIDAVSTTSAATLTAAYRETGGALAATISDIYLAMPADFRSIHTVTDSTNQYPIPWWIARDRLDLFDPGRISSDSHFRILASASISQATPLLGRVLYEAWPHPTAAASYALSYFIRMDALADDTALQGAIATYTVPLERGALSRAAEWPGTPTLRNPYFNLALAQRLADQFEVARQSLDLMDDDQYLLDLQQVDLSRYGLSSLAANPSYLRSSDADLSDYY